MSILKYTYHYVSGINDLSLFKKIGLCSPYYLKENYPDLFKESSFDIYEQRAKTFLNKKEVNDEDIITFLDNNPKYKNSGLNSKALFFSFFPISFYDLFKENETVFNRSLECKIKIDVLKNKIPYLIYKGKIIKTIWRKIESDSFYDELLLEKKNKQGRFVFSNITHLAVNIEHIPSSKMELDFI